MGYPLSFKMEVIQYRKDGHTAPETEKVFQVSQSTIYRWERQLKAKGHLRSEPGIRPHKKIDPDEFRAYLALNPNAYLKEIAYNFGCSIAAIQKALIRNGIVRKGHKGRSRNH